MSAQPAQSPVDSPSMASVLFTKSFAAKPSAGRTPSGDTSMCAARSFFGKLRLPLVVVVGLLLLGAAPARAQDWAKQMFSETSHNFGNVARGAKTEHRFVFRNKYKEDLRVVGVRTSCGCTTPTITKKVLSQQVADNGVCHHKGHARPENVEQQQQVAGKGVCHHKGHARPENN